MRECRDPDRRTSCLTEVPCVRLSEVGHFGLSDRSLQKEKGKRGLPPVHTEEGRSAGGRKREGTKGGREEEREGKKKGGRENVCKRDTVRETTRDYHGTVILDQRREFLNFRLSLLSINVRVYNALNYPTRLLVD